MVLCVCHDHDHPWLNQIQLLFKLYYHWHLQWYILFLKATTLTKVALYVITNAQIKPLRKVIFDLTNTINFPNIFNIWKMYTAFISAFFKS